MIEQMYEGTSDNWQARGQTAEKVAAQTNTDEGHIEEQARKQLIGVVLGMSKRRKEERDERKGMRRNED